METIIHIFKFFLPWSDEDMFFLGAARSSRWSGVRDRFLEGKTCSLCGGTKDLVAHHIKPFHIFPEDELNPSNLIALCEGKSTINCHLIFGHFGDFKKWNPQVVEDATNWAKNIQK